MQVQALNKRAMNKYQELHNALEVVRIALTEAAGLHKKIVEPSHEDVGWQVPSREEVEAAHSKAVEQLNALHGSTVTWEKELVSRGWRV
ncbi:hypothetical protein [Saccharopolyspora sp. NPDC002376]